MNNFIFKSANRLTKNSSIHLGILDTRLRMLLKEQRMQRCDLKDINGKLDRLLVDKHLQMQVDNYYNDSEESSDGRPHVSDSQDLD